MEEIDIAAIKKKSLRGIAALTGRTFLLQIIAFGATFLLTILLSPSAFGVFFVVTALVSFLSYFSDVGLAAALIQKKESLTERDLSTTFTIQQILVVALCIVMFIVAPYIGQFYRLDESGVWLLRALTFAFFISSLKTIPSVLLERRLEFDKLVIPQIAETLAFYGSAVFFAWKGMGLMSFTIAVLARAIVGIIVIYIIQPWRIAFSVDKDVAKRLLKFGIPFQTNSLLSLLKDDLMTVFLGKILTFTEVGYIGWAKKWAEVPLRLIMDSVIRVTFPAFSRLQHSKELIGKAIDKTMFGLASTIIPISVGLLFFIEPAVTLIPKYVKWEPALFAFYCFVVSSLLAAFSTPLTNALNAIGKIKITLGFMVFWTAATWVLTILFVHFFGYNGVPLALLTLSLSVVAVVFVMKRYAPFSFFKNISIPAIAGIFQALLYAYFRGSNPYNIIQLLIVGILGVILYSGIVIVASKDKIREIISIGKKEDV